MRQADLNHINRVQWYTTAPYDCSYLPGLQARSQVAVVEPSQCKEQYDNLIRQGFRRSGAHIYRPQCDSCQACVPVRLLVNKFLPTRSQRRAQRVLDGLQVKVLPLTLKPDHLALYQRYQLARHSDEGLLDSSQGAEGYAQFLLRSHADSNLVEFRNAEQQLLAVAVVDWVADGVSAVYTFFEPDYPASLGTMAVLWLAQAAQALTLPYVYLGYWIQHSPKMAYKANFQPLEYLVNQHWQNNSLI